MNSAVATLALLMVAIVLALAATVYCALQLRFRFTRFNRRLSSLFGLLLVAQSSLIGIQFVGQRSFGGGYEVAAVTAWAVLACALLFNRYLFADLIGVLVCGADTTLLVMALLLRQPGMAGGGLPLLVYLHVSAIVLSYAVLTLAVISAVAYLLSDRALKGKGPGRLAAGLPPLATLQAFTRNFVLIGFVALTAGIVLIQAWVVAAHRPSIFFDPRESWALISWVLYAIYAGITVLGRWEGRRLAFLVIAGYATSLAPAAVLSSLGSRPL
ncbi:MAG TPA: cytochrome c biogenesis protein CcsA [Candidatus Solibacter sp.]|nr:cytochrome c biogenesis protein CcsA [Candidatus Solibacter sp.]